MVSFTFLLQLVTQQSCESTLSRLFPTATYNVLIVNPTWNLMSESSLELRVFLCPGKRFECSNSDTLSVAHFKPSTPCPVIKLNIKRQSLFFKRIVLLQQFTREARRKKNRMASSVKYEWKKKKICKDVGGSRGGNSSVVTTNFGGSFQGDQRKGERFGRRKGA